MKTLAEIRFEKDRAQMERRAGEDRRRRSSECVRAFIEHGKMVERRKAARRAHDAAKTSAMVADFYTRYHAERRGMGL